MKCYRSVYKDQWIYKWKDQLHPGGWKGCMKETTLELNLKRRVDIKMYFKDGGDMRNQRSGGWKKIDTFYKKFRIALSIGIDSQNTQMYACI